jgi:hypothetical protein
VLDWQGDPSRDVNASNHAAAPDKLRTKLIAVLMVFFQILAKLWLSSAAHYSKLH